MGSYWYAHVILKSRGYARLRDKLKRYSLQPQQLWPQNQARQWRNMKSTYLKSYMILQSRGFVRSRGILNTLYSICTRPMATKHGNVVSLHDGIPPIN